MGRMALIIVLALSLTVGIVGYTLNQSKTGLVENVTGFDKYANARNIAHTGVNMVLRKLDRNDTSIINPMLVRKQTAWLVANVMSGVCSVSIKLANPSFLDTVEITSRSHFMDTARVMNVRLHRQPVPFPFINEAVGLNVPNVDFSIKGGAANIDGRNHDINGNLISPADSTYKPGVGVLTSADSSTVAPWSSQINGTPQIKIDTARSDPSSYVADYVNAADSIYPSGTYGSNMVWGSLANPVIVYCDGRQGPVKFSGSIQGWGILVVRGTLVVSGNFTFRGLVIAYNDVTLSKDTIALALGTPDIIGGLLMAGASGSALQLKGNDQISYSKDALDLAKFINKLQVYRVMRWYE